MQILQQISKQVRRFIDDTRAEGMEGKIIGLVVALIITAAVLPVAIEQLVAVDTANWSTAGGALWPLLEIFAVLAIVILVIRYVRQD